MVEYIRGEGPPNFSSKDAIEKNHGVIKDQIFLQNQKARSRNTCLKFVKQSICQHILAGGKFKEW